MSKLLRFFIIFLTIFFHVSTSSAQWADASDFSNEKLRSIARQIVNSNQGDWRIENHVIPHHSQNDALNSRSVGFKTLSYFRLQNHDLETYRTILNYVVDNGDIVIGEEADPKRFSILAYIPNNEMENFGAKEETSIGAWMQGANYRLVSKVKAVFSVINMKKDMALLERAALVGQMKELEDAPLDKRPGDLITVFPIPNNWTR